MLISRKKSYGFQSRALPSAIALTARKIAASFTAITLLCMPVTTPVGLAQSGVESLSGGVSEKALGQLPLKIGKLRDFYRGQQSDKFVIHIQDAHSNPSAQKNIARILHWIFEQNPNQPPIVALEGIRGEPHLEYLDFFPNHVKTNKALVNGLVDQGELTGAEVFAWKLNQGKGKRGKVEGGRWQAAGQKMNSNEPRATSNERQVTGDKKKAIEVVSSPAERGRIKEGGASFFFGVEDAKLYRENLAIYKEFLDNETEIQVSLNMLREEQRKLENNTLSKEAREYLREKRQRKEGDYQTNHHAPQWETYLTYLKKMLKEKVELDLEAPFEQIRFPNAVRLDVLMRAFKDLDLTLAQKQKESFVEEIRKKLRVAEDRELLHAFQSQMETPAFREIAEKVWALQLNYRMDPKQYEELWRMTGRDILQGELDVAGLDEEIHRLEGWLEDSLVETDEERKVFRLGHEFDLLEKLLSLEMSAADVKRGSWRVNPKDQMKGEREKEKEERFKDSNVNNVNFISLDPRPTNRDSLVLWVKKAERFYELALARDKVLLENTLKAAEGRETAVLITGGFHTRGFESLLRERGLGYAVIQPAMTVSDENLYQKVLRDENADIAPYFENANVSRQEGLFFKSIVETGAALLWEKDRVPHSQIANEVSAALNVHPVLKGLFEASVEMEPQQGSRLKILRSQIASGGETPDNQAVVATLITNSAASFADLSGREAASEFLDRAAFVDYQPAGTTMNVRSEVRASRDWNAWAKQKFHDAEKAAIITALTEGIDARLSEDLKPRVLLDVGAGRGELTAGIAPQFTGGIYAIEKNDQSARVLSSRGLSKLKIIAGDFFKALGELGQVHPDLILMSHSLSLYFPRAQRNQLLEQALDQVAVGGKLALVLNSNDVVPGSNVDIRQRFMKKHELVLAGERGTMKDTLEQLGASVDVQNLSIPQVTQSEEEIMALAQAVLPPKDRASETLRSLRHYVNADFPNGLKRRGEDGNFFYQMTSEQQILWVTPPNRSELSLEEAQLFLDTQPHAAWYARYDQGRESVEYVNPIFAGVYGKTKEVLLKQRTYREINGPESDVAKFLRDDQAALTQGVFLGREGDPRVTVVKVKFQEGVLGFFMPAAREGEPTLDNLEPELLATLQKVRPDLFVRRSEVRMQTGEDAPKDTVVIRYDRERKPKFDIPDNLNQIRIDALVGDSALIVLSRKSSGDDIRVMEIRQGDPFLARWVVETIDSSAGIVVLRAVRRSEVRAETDSSDFRAKRREQLRLAAEHEDRAIEAFEELVRSQKKPLDLKDALGFFGQFLGTMDDWYKSASVANAEATAEQGLRVYKALLTYRQSSQDVVEALKSSDQPVFEGFPPGRSELVVITRDKPGLTALITSAVEANIVRDWTVFPVADSKDRTVVMIFEFSREDAALSFGALSKMMNAVRDKLSETAAQAGEKILEGRQTNAQGVFHGSAAVLQGFGYGVSEVVYDIYADLNTRTLEPAERERQKLRLAREDTKRFYELMENQVLPLIEALPQTLGFQDSDVDSVLEFVQQIEEAVIREEDVYRQNAGVTEYRRSALSRFLKKVQLEGPSSGLQKRVIKEIDKVVLHALKERFFIYDPSDMTGQGQLDLVDQQRARLTQAVEQVLTELEKTAEANARAVYEMVRMMLPTIGGEISKRNILAEEAVTGFAIKAIRKLQRSKWDKDRANAADFQDVFTRIILALRGNDTHLRGEVMGAESGADIILFARHVNRKDIAERLEEFRGRVKMIVTDDEDVTKDSHWVQMADNDFGVPTMILPQGTLEPVLKTDIVGEAVSVDTAERKVYIRPEVETRARLSQETDFFNAVDQVALDQVSRLAKTQSGIEIKVRASAESPEQIREAMDQGAAGVGLGRTEYLIDVEAPEFKAWLSDASAENRRALITYFTVRFRDMLESVTEINSKAPMTLRTYDFERDKDLKLPNPDQQYGPAFYATPIGRELLKIELIGMLEAGLDHPQSLRIMFPAFRNPVDLKQFLGRTDLDDLSEAEQLQLDEQARGDIDLMNQVLDEAFDEIDNLYPDKKPTARFHLGKVQTGFMLETIEGIRILDHILDRADFISVGTTDMTISLFRKFENISRDNPEHAAKFSELQPEFLEAVRAILNRVSAWNQEKGTEVGVDFCGGLAGVDSVVLGLVQVKPDNVIVGISRSARIIATTKFWIRQAPTGAEDQEGARQILTNLWQDVRGLSEVTKKLEEIQGQRRELSQETETTSDRETTYRTNAERAFSTSTSLSPGQAQENRIYRLGPKGFHIAPVPSIVKALAPYPNIQVYVMIDGMELSVKDPFSMMALGLPPESSIELRVVGPSGELPAVFSILETLRDITTVEFDAAGNAIEGSGFLIFEKTDMTRETSQFPNSDLGQNDADSSVASVLNDGPSAAALKDLLLADEARVYREPQEEGRDVFTLEMPGQKYEFMVYAASHIAVSALTDSGEKKLAQNILATDPDHGTLMLFLGDLAQARSEVRSQVFRQEFETMEGFSTQAVIEQLEQRGIPSTDKLTSLINRFLTEVIDNTLKASNRGAAKHGDTLRYAVTVQSTEGGVLVGIESNLTASPEQLTTIQAKLSASMEEVEARILENTMRLIDDPEGQFQASGGSGIGLDILRASVNDNYEGASLSYAISAQSQTFTLDLPITAKSEVRRTKEVKSLKFEVGSEKGNADFRSSHFELPTILFNVPATQPSKQAALKFVKERDLGRSEFSPAERAVASVAGRLYSTPTLILPRETGEETGEGAPRAVALAAGAFSDPRDILESYGRIIRAVVEDPNADAAQIEKVREIIQRNLNEIAQTLEGNSEVNYQYLDYVDSAELNEDTPYALAVLSMIRPTGDQIRLYVTGDDGAVRESIARVTAEYESLLVNLGAANRANLEIINVSGLDSAAIQKEMQAFATGKNGKLQAAVLSARVDFLNEMPVLKHVRRMNRAQVSRSQALLASPALLAAAAIDEHTLEILQMREELERLGLGVLLSERFAQMIAEVKALSASA